MTLLIAIVVFGLMAFALIVTFISMVKRIGE